MKFIFAAAILGLVTLTHGQKHPKLNAAHKLGGGAAAAGGAQAYSNGNAAAAQTNHYQAAPYQGGAGYNALNKPNHALLLSDSRTLNNDGTINFQYAADNGLQQGETVDSDGTRRGFYSYPGADGKPITVKYTAGKNGFQAEGDHLPRQPQVAPHSDKAHSGLLGSEQYDDGSYRPEEYSNNRGHVAARPAYTQAQPQVHGGQGQGGHAQAGHGHRAGPQIHYSAAPVVAHQPAYRPQQIQYSAGQGQGGAGAGFYGGQGQDFGPVNYGAPSHAAAPQTQYTHAAPAPARFQGGGGGVNSVLNPYQQQGPAGPYAGNFDLGNGGQFSINFNPGKSQEVRY